MKEYFCRDCGETWTARPPTEMEENDPRLAWDYLYKQHHCPRCGASGTEVKQ